jgi:hypothetical protein
MLFLLFSCYQIEVSQPWEIDRLRILAVASEPAEPKPGDTVSFSSLVLSPDDPVAAVIWFACTTGGEFGCDTSALSELDFSDPENLDPQVLLDAGLIGAEPYLPPSWVVPADFLDALSEEERLEGAAAMISLTAIPESAAAASGEELQDINLVESAYKRVPVSLAPTPNHNPKLAGIQVDTLPAVAPGTTLYLEPAQTYELTVVLSEDSLESYIYHNNEGVDEERIEEPYFTWYAQEGSFDQTAVLYPTLTVKYTTPAAPDFDAPSIWVVVRDRRGGMGWLEVPIRYL